MKSRIRFTCAVLLLLLLNRVSSTHAADVTIRLERPAETTKPSRSSTIQQADERKAPARFTVAGLPPQAVEKLSGESIAEADWHGVFEVFVLTDGKPSSAGMLGSYELTAGELRFTPRYPLQAGLAYRAVFDPSGLPALASAGLVRVQQEFQLPALAAGPATRLTQIYPTSDVMPENLLKFYLHFSAPMSRGEAYRRIRLFDKQGKVVEHPFLELSEELWSPDGMRFTLYFDPGRIKRGLKPREEFGPALAEGGRYTLVVDKEWLDARNQPLAETVRKEFRVVAPDDIQPSPDRWQIAAPAAGTREPLSITFDESLDAAMLVRVLVVQDARQRSVAGQVRLSDHERRWQLEPASPWEAGLHYLVAATTLEDLAGNSIGRPFEVDVFRPANPRATGAVVELTFRVK